MKKIGASSLIHNIGALVSGDIENPILKEDAVVIKEGVIERVGSYEELRKESFELDIDVQGMTLCPGLIDTHVHPLFYDYSACLSAFGWMEAALHCGVTTFISQGEFLWPGKPTDASGVKAVAILARKAYENYRPGGAKVHAGALVLEEGVTEDDIKEMANEGVWLIAEIGVGGLSGFGKIKSIVGVAKKYGFKVSTHFGPESQGARCVLTTEETIGLNPDVICHFNGGSTAASLADMKLVVEKSPAFLELILNGSPKALNESIDMVRERGEFRRFVLGTDQPTPLGIIPHAIMKVGSLISGVNGVPGAVVLAFATGNAARAFGLNRGMIKPGREADLIVLGPLMKGRGKTALETLEAGDCPALGMVMVDGKVITRQPSKMRNTLKKVLINGQEEPEKTTEERMFPGVWID